MFISLTPSILVAPQISADAVAEAAAQGVTLIINNRPEGESADQTAGEAIAAAAHAAGLDYVAIPITHSGFSQPQITAMVEALNGAKGPSRTRLCARPFSSLEAGHEDCGRRHQPPPWCRRPQP